MERARSMQLSDTGGSRQTQAAETLRDLIEITSRGFAFFNPALRA